MVVLPSSLVGRHLGKSFELSLNNLLISQHIRIVGCSFFITCFISLYCAFSENLGSIHFVFFVLSTFCEFSQVFHWDLILNKTCLLALSPTRWRLYVSSCPFIAFLIAFSSFHLRITSFVSFLSYILIRSW